MQERLCKYGVLRWRHQTSYLVVRQAAQVLTLWPCICGKRTPHSNYDRETFRLQLGSRFLTALHVSKASSSSQATITKCCLAASDSRKPNNGTTINDFLRWANGLASLFCRLVWGGFFPVSECYHSSTYSVCYIECLPNSPPPPSPLPFPPHPIPLPFQLNLQNYHCN